MLFQVFNSYVICAKFNVLNDFLILFKEHETNMKLEHGQFIYENYILVAFKDMLSKIKHFEKHLEFNPYMVPLVFSFF